MPNISVFRDLLAITPLDDRERHYAEIAIVDHFGRGGILYNSHPDTTENDLIPVAELHNWEWHYI